MIIKYEHYGKKVSVQEHLKGKHREHCLCWQNCKNFKPNIPENCKLAQENYQMCIRNNMVLPVWECAEYVQGEI